MILRKGEDIETRKHSISQTGELAVEEAMGF
jgi:hypothetical protein